LRGSSILDSFGLEVIHKEPKKERRLSFDSDVSAAVLVLTTLQAEEADRPARVSNVLSAKTADRAQARIEKRNENHDDDDDDDDRAEGDDDDDDYVT
jgi:hypothetical protein